MDFEQENEDSDHLSDFSDLIVFDTQIKKDIKTKVDPLIIEEKRKCEISPFIWIGNYEKIHQIFLSNPPLDWNEIPTKNNFLAPHERISKAQIIIPKNIVKAGKFDLHQVIDHLKKNIIVDLENSILQIDKVRSKDFQILGLNYSDIQPDFFKKFSEISALSRKEIQNRIKK